MQNHRHTTFACGQRSSGAVLPAAWIRNVGEEIFAGWNSAFTLDQFHALEYAAAAVQALAQDRGERQARMERIKQQLNARQVDRVIDDPEPRQGQSRGGLHRPIRGRQGSDACDRCRKLGLPVGSCVVEIACRQTVGSRFKRAACRWSNAGANALLASECCIENNRWADFLDWRACRAAVAGPKNMKRTRTST